MARIGVSYEEVATAADDLLKEGCNPTIEGVRHQIGAGSFTTLSKHLNAWRSKRLMAVIKEEPHKITPPDEVSHAVQGVWQQLTSQANQQLEALKQEYATEVTELTEAKQALSASNENLQKTLTQAEIKINHLSTDIALLQKVLSEERQARADLEKELRHMQEKLQQSESNKTSQISELKNTYEKMSRDWGKYTEVLRSGLGQEMQGFLKELEKQRTDFMVRLDELKIAKEKVDKALGKSETALKQEFDTNATQAKELVQLRNEHQLLQQRYNEAQHVSIKQVAEMTAYQNMLQLQETRVQELKQQLDNVNTYLAAQANKHEQMNREQLRIGKAEVEK